MITIPVQHKCILTYDAEVEVAMVQWVSDEKRKRDAWEGPYGLIFEEDAECSYPTAVEIVGYLSKEWTNKDRQEILIWMISDHMGLHEEALHTAFQTLKEKIRWSNDYEGSC